MRFLTCRNCFRRAFTDNIATGYSAFRAYVDDVVGALNYFHVVLDNNDRMPSFYKCIKCFQQCFDIVKM